MDDAMYSLIDRLKDDPDDDRSDAGAIADAVLDALWEHPTFRAVAVDVEDLKSSTRVEGDTEGTWTAMDAGLQVLSGTVVIDWTDADHLSGSVTVYVGSAGLVDLPPRAARPIGHQV